MTRKFMLRKLLSVAVLATSLAVLPARGVSQPGLQSRSKGSQARVQERLEKQILHELRMLPYYSVFDNIEFQVRGRDVELMGQVVRATLKSDAEAAVRKVEGVETVSNNIEVLPVSINDDRIRRATYRAIYGHPVLQRYAINPAVAPIHIIVKRGHVTLVGVVATRMESDVANIQANSVPGAFSVSNQLHVEKG